MGSVCLAEIIMLVLELDRLEAPQVLAHVVCPEHTDRPASNYICPFPSVPRIFLHYHLHPSPLEDSQ